MTRIEDNENRLDKLSKIVSDFDKCFTDFEESLNDYYLLNKYYGSKKWLKDKEDYECGRIDNIKAGVLSEDAVWNLDEEVRDLFIRMDKLLKRYNKNKNSH